MLRNLFIVIFFICLIIPLSFVKADESVSLIINEAMVNPIGSDTDFEWLELKNLAKNPIELANFYLNEESLPTYELQPGALIILARNPLKVSNQYNIPEASILEFPLSLINSGGSLKLHSINSEHTFNYDNASEGVSFEYLTGNCGLIAKHPDSHSILAENTVCASFEPTQKPDLTEYPNLLEISAILPNPESGSEWVEISNHHDFEVTLKDWFIKDVSNKTDQFSTTISAGDSYKVNLSKVSLNNSGDNVRLIAPNGSQVDLFHYTSSKKGEVLSTAADQISCEVSVEENNVVDAKQVNFAVKPSPTISLDIPKIYRLK